MRLKEDDLDYLLLKDGNVIKYHNTDVLEGDIEWLDKNNYDLIDIDTASWNSNNFHQSIKSSFSFPDYYGENLNAFADCLSDMKNAKYKGLVIVLRRFDNFTDLDRVLSESLLDAISSIARRWVLQGFYLLCLVQSDDPDITYDKIGGYAPNWNGVEWFDDDRRNKIIRSSQGGEPPELL